MRGPLTTTSPHWRSPTLCPMLTEPPTPLHLPDMRELAGRLTKARAFEFAIIALIVANGVLLGLETSPRILDHAGDWLHFGERFILWVFVAEASLKIFAVSPKVDRYFRDGWNLFDFTIVVLAFIPAVGPFAIVARLARLARILRLVSALPELRLIVTTMVRSIPGMLNIVVLISIVAYIYAIIGYQIFHEHDPEHWRNLGISLLSLFRVITLEDWTDIMYTAMELHPWAWLYFVSFVVLASFVVINLFIAVVINNLNNVKEERLRAIQQPKSADALISELRATQDSLRRLEDELHQRRRPDGTLADPP